MSEIILTNLYWFSLPLIGFAILKIIKDNNIFPRLIRGIADIALRQDPFMVFIISFSATYFLYAVFSVFFYVFQLKVEYFVFIYVVMLIMAIVYLSRQFLRSPLKLVNHLVSDFNRQILLAKLLIVAISLILFGDFLLSIYEKSFPVGDATFHLSRIVDILANGFNIQSSFHSNLTESAYHYNAIYAIFAVPARLFGMPPFVIWEYSLGFFRLLQWSAIFVLAYHVFSKWLRLKNNVLILSLLTLVASIAFNFSWYYIANYPSRIILIWVTLLIILLSMQNERNSWKIGIPMIAIGFLITMTHPGYGAVTAIFLFFLFFTRLIFQRKQIIENGTGILVNVLTLGTLMICPVITRLMPVRLNHDLMNLSAYDIPTTKIFGMTILAVNPTLWSGRMNLLFLVTSIVATLYLLIKMRKSKTVWTIVLAQSFFYIFIAYEPIGYAIIRAFFPLWFIDYFSLINVISKIYVGIALFALFDCIKWALAEYKKNDIKFENRVLIIMIVVVFVNAIPITQANFESWDANAISRSGTYMEYRRLETDYKSWLKDDDIVVSYRGDSYLMTSIFPIDIVSVSYGHFPMTSDAQDRMLCSIHIMRSFNYQDIIAVKAKYVLVNGSVHKKVMDGLSNMKFIKTSGTYHLYEVVKTNEYDLSKVYGPCLEYQRKEKE